MKTNRNNRRAAILLLTAAAALTVLAAGCSGGGAGGVDTAAVGTTSAERPVAVRVQQPEHRLLEERISYVGTVFAGQEVRVISRVQGTLSAQAFTDGERFQQGDLLGFLESPEIDAAVERAESEMDYWCTRHETDKRLVEQGALAPEQAQASERACRSARAGLDEARAQFNKTRVEAPFTGEVLDWLAEPGQPLMPGQPLVLIGSPAREVRVDVVEEDIERGVDVGTTAAMRLGAETVVEAPVTRVAPAASGPARAFAVTVPIPATGAPAPRKGASISVNFILERAEDALAVPSRAIAGSVADPGVFVISDGTAHRRPVTTGISEGGWTAADFDWNGTDPIAVTNVRSLSDGAPVFPVAEEALSQ